MPNVLQKLLTPYDELPPLWQYDNIKNFSATKQLFTSQRQALKNFLVALYLYFSNFHNPDVDSEEQKTLYAKREFFKLYEEHGVNKNILAVKQFASAKRRTNYDVDKRFKFLSKYFKPEEDENLGLHIPSYHFINRMAFWMATGSGKSLIIIKAIEILDYLQSVHLIPQREILVLFPREDLINQFKKLVDEYNKSIKKRIRFLNLKEYLDRPPLPEPSTIKVLYYRSDLIRTQQTEKFLNFESFENNGKWYLFLDEAHKGAKGESFAQDIFTVLSRNGFLFNFSATFTDEIDRVTTVFNFNLEKFITEGYGKNIYLSESTFSLQNQKEDDFSEAEKQKQVLKALILLTLIKKSWKNKNLYHAPLMITLVNSVNTDDSDLLLFFREIDKIATGKIKSKALEQAKTELIEEFNNNPKYFFGDERLSIDTNLIATLTIEDILKNVFNTTTFGKIEFLEGEKGKELALKLESADKPFGLIKIGNTKRFQKEKLGFEYNVIESFETRKYFEQINNRPEITLLLGSRSFYEGWDSNRPNVINFINIGKGAEAQKFVLQAIGRGIRIEPKKYNDPEKSRKRLPSNDTDKNQLLETLFVFATDKKSVGTILKELKQQKNPEEEISIGNLFDKNKPEFDLLIPMFKDEETEDRVTPFYINTETKERFLNYLRNISPNVFLVKYGLTKKRIAKLFSDDLYAINPNNVYSDFELLLEKVIDHIKTKIKVVGGVKELTDEIIHFKHIKVSNLNNHEVSELRDSIKEVKKYKPIKLDPEKEKALLILRDSGAKVELPQPTKEFYLANTKLRIVKIVQHYYVPLIYSYTEKQEYIKHIITTESERKFIEALEKYIKNRDFDFNWMFSKIDEHLDKVYIPYYSHATNTYKKFYPDFIFWLQKGNKYKIIFVDPKGTAHTDYESKVDGFERLFLDNEGKPKVFKYKKFKIIFELRLIGDAGKVGEKYRKYWRRVGDFSFLQI